MNCSSAHLGVVIIRAGHDPTEHPHLLCKLVRICPLLYRKFPHFLHIDNVTQLQPYHADADHREKLLVQLVQPLPRDGSGRFSFCLGRLRIEVKANIASHILRFKELPRLAWWRNCVKYILILGFLGLVLALHPFPLLLEH